MILYARLLLRLWFNFLASACFLLIDLIHPQEKSTDDNRERNDHEPWIDAEHGWNGQFTEIAELEKIILNQRIDFRVNTRADQNAQNTAKQTI